MVTINILFYTNSMFHLAATLLITPGKSAFENCEGPMLPDERDTLLREHNKYRSNVALGKYKIKASGSKLTQLPTAVRMIQLKYNCSLEASSLQWATDVECKMIHSQTNGVGENLFVTSPRTNHNKAAEKAVSMWAEEINKYGVQSLRDSSSGIGHATQVFWANTRTVGCGIVDCSDKTMVICQYYPSGNYVGAKWYEEGKVLDECGKNNAHEVAHSNTGLCELKD
ncbi:SCP-like protein [Dictyocaulus viviparus]|uniref:SCP-like protein n=1 Tax=Dictyocaulus viviparus TaxID=29172 RepID=A0A0D8Y102_DICVI|nr:SCP-like protein [Dictyocaulus viviparus]